MMRRGAIIGAVVVYLAVMLGCVFSVPGTSPTVEAARQSDSPHGANAPKAKRTIKLPLRGVGMQIQRIDWIDEYKKSIDEVADLGADAVLLVVDARMENGASSCVYLDMRLTPTPDQLAQLIDHAKKRKLRVMLMPIVLLDNPRGMEWRGTINPDDWPRWWESYRAMLYHYCWIAEGHGVDVLVVGSELVSTETKSDEWHKTIAMVRQYFGGMLTYSSNWDHYKDIPFWDQLDLIAMNSYWALGRDHRVKPEEIQQRWADIQKNVLGFSRQKGKPLLFTEVGWHSLRNTAHEPWDYTQLSQPIDLDLQKRLYEGFFKAWYGNPGLGGFFIWEWTPGDGGPDNRGYTPEGKPAANVVREWMAKPAWDVK